MQKYFKQIFIFFICFFVLFLGRKVLAQDLGFDYTDELGLTNQSIGDPREILVNIVGFFLTFLGIIAIIMILYGGFVWMTAQGQADKVDKAKKILISAIIGLVIVISAYAIVNLVINTAETVIDGSLGLPSDDGENFNSSNSAFRVRRTSPRDEKTEVIRNVTIKAFLSDEVAPDIAQSELNNNFTIEKIADVDEEGNVTPNANPVPLVDDVSTSSNSSVLNRNSSDDCSSEGTLVENCFAAWTRYRVTFNESFVGMGSGGIVSVNGVVLDCDVPASEGCSFDFSTSDLVDTEGPSSGIISTQICEDSSGSLPEDVNVVGAWGRDDIGVSEMRFYYQEGASAPQMVMPPTGGNSDTYQYAENTYDNTYGFAAGDTYTFSIEVEDMAGATSSDSFTSIIREEHCCNGVLDEAEGEVEVDCGGPCDSCESRNPVILWLSPDNGATSSFVTIGGRYFGDTPGRVYFSDGNNGWIEAPFPDTVNSACQNNWQNNQIIVVVPETASTGPVRILRSDLREDTTDNEYGPQINDFEVNLNTYPGLCMVSPETGELGDELSYYGIAFSGSDQGVFFGNDTSYIESSDSNFYTDMMASGTVPNLSSGRTTTFVRANGEMSNFLYFTVSDNSGDGPIIDYIDPEEGAIGEYVTIFGSGFGNYDNLTSKVEFIASDGTPFLADGSDFPEECQDSWWGRNQIVVKAPSTMTVGEVYDVVVTNRSNLTSNSQSFTFTPGLPGPGICLLDPDNGPVNIRISIFGDNFGDSQGGGFVRFVGSSSVTRVEDWGNQEVEVNLPLEAETGAVRVSNTVDLSNSLNFEVGACTDDSDCDTAANRVCCGGGTYWAGVCRAENDCNDDNLDLTGYGWFFSTGEGDETVQTCGGYDDNAACMDAGYCPNSPGTCQTTTDLDLNIVCNTDACNSTFSQCEGDCVYNSTTNRCESVTDTCSQNFSLAGFEDAVCRLVNNQPLWQVNDVLACRNYSYRDIANEWCTVGVIGAPEICSLCDEDFICDAGTCVVSQGLCPENSSCVSEACLLDNEVCECCCEVGQDARDCCLGLTCLAGNCGNDPVNFGLCSGCRVNLDNDLTNLTFDEQQASDAACNCEGTEGKYCYIADPSDSTDTGVCQDAKPCDGDLYSDGCDAETMLCDIDEYCDPNDCFCKPGTSCDGDGNVLNGCSLDIECDPVDEYCDPSDCFCKEGQMCDSDLSNAVCGADADDMMCDLDEICNPTTCLCEPEPAIPGDPCYSEEVNACNPYVCGSAYECLTESWESEASACGYCCCNLDDANTENDSCRSLGSNLYCAQDTDNGSNCYDSDTSSAPNFGICCGCSSDSECSGGVNQGCGNDSCCRPRPEVSSVTPDDEADVCRNAGIVVEFNEEMDKTSLKDNFILLGDYGQNECPHGTTYLTMDDELEKKYNIFQRISYKTLKIAKNILNTFLDSKNASAYIAPNTNSNYCAIDGQISSYVSSAEVTVMEFKPRELLDPNQVYYAIIKGNINLNSEIGVKNEFGIALNAQNSPSGNDNTFNNVDYSNSYIWSFTTLDDDEAGGGICEVSRIEILPESYLFQTTEGDLNEVDDDPDGNNFDEAEDNDKVFVARALSQDGQIVFPVTGYSWDYYWEINATDVINFSLDDPFLTNGDRRLIQAQDGAVDGRATLRARALSSGVIDGLDDVDKWGQSQVYVFLCQNPWPSIDEFGLWEPWRDDGGNCIGGGGICHDTNYELYYCRDTGSDATFDDLPAIQDESTVNLSQTLICSVGNTNCPNGSSAGDACGPGNTGICELKVLKESFFFRADIPDISLTTLNGNINTAGEAVDLFWTDVGASPTGEPVSSYKIYYGTRSRNYVESVSVRMDQDHSSISPFTITGLQNGTTYFFAITAVFTGGGESSFSNERELTPEDEDRPNAPANLQATPRDSEIELSWGAVADAVSYKIYYGVNTDVYGNSQDVGDTTELIVSSLSNGQTYYMAVTAVDENGLESDYSNEVVATPEEIAVGLFQGGDIVLTWNTSGGGEYNVYLVEIE